MGAAFEHLMLNPALNPVRFARWALRDKAAQGQ
ncbi:MAG: hypothetical protein H6R17_2744 [Proteobacteria bacterium]|nr:hypothetical protein [Pseudomonadota bacterium]